MIGGRITGKLPDVMSDPNDRSRFTIEVLKSMISVKKLLLVAGLLSTCTVGHSDMASAQVVALGASNVAGSGVGSSDAWPAQLEAMLAAKGRNIRVTNAGINSNTNAQMLARLDSAVPNGTKLVILDKLGGAYNAAARAANVVGQKISMTEIGKLISSPAGQKAELAEIEKRLRSRGIKVIPMWYSLAAMRPYLQADGRHLTAEGHKLEASKMLPAVMSAVR